MNISKELHDAMLEIGFVFTQTTGTNQTEPNFIFASITYEMLDKKFEVRIPNKNDVTISFVTGLLCQEAQQSGLIKGYKDGKKSVGEYLKSLTD
jgi:hypothetical protein